MEVLDRAGGPATSPVENLRLPGLRGLQLFAYGSTGGTVVVQQLQTPRDAVAAAASTAAVPPQPSTVLVLQLRSPAGAARAEEVSAVSWSGAAGGHGAAACLLAAAAGTAVCVFRLQAWVHSLLESEPQDNPDAAHVHPPADAIAAATLPHAVLALDWASRTAEALLITDAAGGVSLWRLVDAEAGGRDSGRLQQLWAGQASQPQDLVSAGGDPALPCGTAACGSRQVTLWWPQAEQPPIDAETPAKAGVRAEVLKMTVGVVGLDWSPAQLGKTAPAYEDLWGNVHGGQQAAAAGASLPASHPALLTVGADGVIRIWVEVVMTPRLGTDAPPPVKGTPSPPPPISHYCVQLVLEPSGGGVGSSGPTHLQAAWAHPDGDGGQRGRAGKLLWVVAVGRPGRPPPATASGAGVRPVGKAEGADRVWLWAVDGLAGVVVNGLPNTWGGARLLCSPQVLLWGQHSGQQLHWQSSSYDISSSRRRLASWLRFDGAAPALDVFEACGGGRSAAEFRCYMIDTVSEDMAAGSSPKAAAGTPRSATATPQLPLRCLVQHCITGHRGDIASLAAHPSRHGLLASADALGTVVVWRQHPLQPLATILPPAQTSLSQPALPEGDQPGGIAGGADAAVSSAGSSSAAVAWLPQQGGGGAQGKPRRSRALLAVADAAQLRILECSISGGGSAAEVASAAMPDGCRGVRALVALACPAMDESALVVPYTPDENRERSSPGMQPLDAGATAKQKATVAIETLPLQGKQSCLDLLSQAALSCVTAFDHPVVQLGVGDSRGGVRLLHLTAAGSGVEVGLVAEVALSCQAGAAQVPCGLALSSTGSYLAASALQQGSSESALHLWQCTRSGRPCRYEEESMLPLPAPPTGLAFLPPSHLVPSVLVACGRAGVLLVSRQHGFGWAAVAELGCLGLPVLQLVLAAGHFGIPAVAVGNQLAVLSDRAKLTKSGSAAESLPLAELTLRTSGPLPEWHPAVLRALLLGSRLAAASAVLRAVLTFLQQQASANARAEGVEAAQPTVNVAQLVDASLLRWAAATALAAKTAAPPATAASTPAPAAPASQPAGQAISATKPSQSPVSDPYALDPDSFAGAASQESPPDAMPTAAAAADPYAFDPNSFAGAAQMQPSTSSAPAADPFAFDASSFGVPAPTEQGRSSTPADADPHAFDPNNFGIQAESAEAPARPSTTTAADPYAFDPTSFGSQAEPVQPSAKPATSAAADPYAFDPASFESQTEPVQPPAQSATSAAADPYAFDPASFESQAEPLQPPAQPATSASADPYAFDPSSFGISAEEPEPPATAAPADVYAFNPSAFGTPAEEAEPAPHAASAAATAADPYAFDPGSFGIQTEEEQPAAQPSGAAADPYACNPDSFGIPAASQPSERPTSQPAATQMPKAAADPFAFEPAAFGMAPEGSSSAATAATSQPQPSTADPCAFDAAAFGGHPAAAPATEPQPPTSSAPQPSLSDSAATLGRQVTVASAETAPPELPLLSAEELQQLRRLLQVPAAGGGADPEESEALGLLRSSAPVGAQPALPGLTQEEAAQLLDLAELVVQAAQSRTRASPGATTQAILDQPAQQTLLHFRLALLPAVTSAARCPPAALMPPSLRLQRGPFANGLDAVAEGGGGADAAPWLHQAGLMAGVGGAAVMWALQSTAQAALLDALLDAVPEEAEAAVAKSDVISFTAARKSAPPGTQLSWPRLRKLGAGFWLTDAAAVRAKAEALAKAQFAAQRDPHAVALLYLALGKQSLLQGLFRSGTGTKVLADFLARDFREQRHREAASKNAYVLLGQHRHELAAAFFILGGSYRDAVGVCAHELEDPQLALLVARLLQANHSCAGATLLTDLISSDLLPDAEAAEDSWAAAVLQWLAGRSTAALSALLPPLPPSPQHGGCTAEEGDEKRMHPDPAALDVLRQCGSLPSVRLWAGPSTLQRLHALAAALAHSREVEGLPLLALELFQVATLTALTPLLPTSLPPQQTSASHQEQSDVREASGAGEAASVALERVVWEGWGLQLVAAAVVRLVAERGSAEAAWKAAATEQLTALRGIGISIEIDRALMLLEEVYAALHPDPAATRFIRRASDSTVPESLTSSRASTPAHGRRRSSSSAFGPHLGGSQRSAGSGGGASVSAAPGAVVGEGLEVFRVEGARLHALATCREVEISPDGAELRPVVASASHGGLIEGALLTNEGPSRDDASNRASDGSAKGSIFSSLVSHMLEAVRWPPETWDSSSAGAAAPGRRGGHPFSSSSPGASPSFAHEHAAANQVVTAALGAHPCRRLYLSGSAGGELYLWRFGQHQSVAAYTPLPASMRDPLPSASSMPLTFSPAHKSLSTALALPYWGQATAVRWSECGERFAGVGEGGVVATWRLDAPRAAATGGLGRADWCLQGLSKRGCDVAYVGGSSSVVAVAGQCSQGGNIVLWDTLAPPGPTACVARLAHHQAAVTRLAVLPGGWLLASGDEAGALALKDLRLLGGPDRGKLVWEHKAAHRGAIAALLAGLRRGGDGSAPAPLLASGGRDGVVQVWAPEAGALLQSIDTSAHSRARGFFTDALGKRSSVAALDVCEEGLLSAGTDGAVKFYGFV